MIQIRKITRSDGPHWADMRHALWPQSTQEEHLQEIHDLIGQNDWGLFLAEENGSPLGFIEVSLRPYANGCDTSPVAFVEGIWVAENWRHKGVGRQLIQAAEKWAESRGLAELGSDTEITNTLSQTAHRGWGFEETERVVYFRKKLRVSAE
ncbi:aminoglycoside 6'-N-acetyltransferase [Oligoflexus tunisiensis]|uniref:aminoglycoside 6'-N-acetyltransferase n=1 Tax=Oligoflexus tunisiensis TaxID=708132 RepID=UPI000B060E72|nr:aminoglycoside 6'-N-acetyltransferase [Oligoflexus tunisiensis]